MVPQLGRPWHEPYHCGSNTHRNKCLLPPITTTRRHDILHREPNINVLQTSVFRMHGLQKKNRPHTLAYFVLYSLQLCTSRCIQVKPKRIYDTPHQISRTTNHPELHPTPQIRIRASNCSLSRFPTPGDCSFRSLQIASPHRNNVVFS